MREVQEITGLMNALPPGFRATLKHFVDRECTAEKVARMGNEPAMVADLRTALVSLGAFGILIPEDTGGTALGLPAMAEIVETLGEVGVATPLITSAAEAASLVALRANDAQRRVWQPAIASGAMLWTTAVNERGSEYMPESLQTVATVGGTRIRLTGTKTYVPYVEIADRIIVVARTDAASNGIGLFVVPTRTRGVSWRRLNMVDYQPRYDVEFEDVSVEPSAVLGPPSGAWAAVEHGLNVGAALSCFELLGLGQRALRLTIDFVSTRIQFGQPIGKFQAVQHHCAQMYLDLERCRVLAEQAVLAIAAGATASREVSMAKAYASSAVPRLFRTAHQLHGGVGFYREYALAALHRRALVAATTYGSSPWHHERLASLLLSGAPQSRPANAHPLPKG